mmetsp:Transcript_5223/g.4409  ORF Transcript_5223/g.4409 Transcript_5223/m.4409 type:complete len:80 (+) Transcript_5223:146-385(+)
MIKMGDTPSLSPLGKALVAINARMNLENALSMTLEEYETAISEVEDEEDLLSICTGALSPIAPKFLLAHYLNRLIARMI